MPNGTVKWFNNAKGYGFILSAESGGDIFAHYSAINMDGYKTLKAGQEVQFDIVEGTKGMHAANIRPSGSNGVTDGAADHISHTDGTVPAQPSDTPENIS